VAYYRIQLLASPWVFLSLSSSSEFPSLTPISDSDIFKALKRLKSSGSVGLDNILGFDIKCCSDTLVPVLKCIFTISLSQQYFPTSWKQTAIVPVLKKGNSVSVSNYGPISILKNLFKLFEFIMRENVSHYLKFKLNPCQHGFPKWKSTTANWVTYLHFMTPLVDSQPQADAIHFDLASAFDLIAHAPLLPKLSALGFSGLSQLPTQQTFAGPYFWHCSIAFPSIIRCSTRICCGAPAFQHVYKQLL
jgi:hypothetical protein